MKRHWFAFDKIRFSKSQIIVTYSTSFLPELFFKKELSSSFECGTRTDFQFLSGPFEVFIISSTSRKAFIQHSNNKPSMLPRRYWSAHQRVSRTFVDCSTNLFKEMFFVISFTEVAFSIEIKIYKNNFKTGGKLLKNSIKSKENMYVPPLATVQNYICKTLSRYVYANTFKLPKCIPGQA